MYNPSFPFFFIKEDLPVLDKPQKSLHLSYSVILPSFRERAYPSYFKFLKYKKLYHNDLIYKMCKLYKLKDWHKKL